MASGNIEVQSRAIRRQMGLVDVVVSIIALSGMLWSVTTGNVPAAIVGSAVLLSTDLNAIRRAL